MGSLADDKEEVTVLVTGFGPFKEEYPVNPSFEIARGLPEHLPAHRAKDMSAREIVDGAGVTAPVRIVVHPEAIRVNYKTVRALVPQLWDAPVQGRNVDIVVHIGMASSRPAYGIERRGHRRGYMSLDVDRHTLEDEEDGGHGPGWAWDGLPDALETDLDVEDILQRWLKLSPADADLHISGDAGHYLCDFIYYSSLARLYKQQRPRKVIFLHVPAPATQEAVALGRELAVNLIRAIVESETWKKKRAV